MELKKYSYMLSGLENFIYHNFCQCWLTLAGGTVIVSCVVVRSCHNKNTKQNKKKTTTKKTTKISKEDIPFGFEPLWSYSQIKGRFISLQVQNTSFTSSWAFLRFFKIMCDISRAEVVVFNLARQLSPLVGFWRL